MLAAIAYRGVHNPNGHSSFSRHILKVDLIHGLEYPWKAAYAFAKAGTSAAEDWVSEQLLRLLQGDASQVAAGMRRPATLRQFELQVAAAA